MASRQSTVDFVLEQCAAAGTVRARKMFGEYGIYCGAKFVAVVCDDQLFVKPTAGGRAAASNCPEGVPFPGAKPWLLVPGDRCEEREWLAALIRATADELPLPSPRKRR